jgi:DNA polymerase-1
MAATDAKNKSTSELEAILELNNKMGFDITTISANKHPTIQKALKLKVSNETINQIATLHYYLAKWRIIEVEDIQTMVKALSKAAQIAIDIETLPLVDHSQAGLLPVVTAIRLVQLFDGKHCYIIDARKFGLEWLRELKHIKMIAHNAQFEDAHLCHAGIDLDNLHCTLLMGRVFIGELGLGLDKMVADVFDFTLDKTLQISNWSRETLLPEQIEYAAADAVFAWELADKFASWFEEYPHYLAAYEFLRELIRPTTLQRSTGIMLDHDAHNKLIAEWENQEQAALKILNENGLQGNDVASSNKKQAYLKKYLTEAQIENWPKTEGGGLKTTNDALLTLGDISEYPQLAAIGQWAAVSSRLKNYGYKLQKLAVAGVLYPDYRIAGMAGYRFQANNPNIQNQPRENFKQVYIAPQGWVFVSSDLSQVELRVAALLSEETVILEAYSRGEDLHLMMAQEMIKVMPKDALKARLIDAGNDNALMLKRMRTAAKGVNFGLLFGGGAKGLQTYVKASYGVIFTLKEATLFKKLFHSKYKDLSQWQQLIVKHSNNANCTESHHARLTRHFSDKDYYKKNQPLHSEPYTVSMNHPVQSTAFEILAIAIKYIHNKANRDDIRLSHHVYDELIVICREGLQQQAAQLIYDAFATGYRTVFPKCNLTGICEVGAGKTWADAGKESNAITISTLDA